VVFEAGLFGGVLGMRRTFILHASGAKLPSDLLGLTCIRYGEAMTPTEMRCYWKGERPRDPNAPQLEGTGEIRLESADRVSTLDGRDDRTRAELMAERLEHWRSITGA
jgi:hypothetical protein